MYSAVAGNQWRDTIPVQRQSSVLAPHGRAFSLVFRGRPPPPPPPHGIQCCKLDPGQEVPAAAAEEEEGDW